MDVMGFIADNMGHFALQDIALLLFQMLVAALLGAFLARVGGRLPAEGIRELALCGAASALGAGLVGAQLPLAVLLLAFAVLVRGGESSRTHQVLRFGAMVMGLGCGPELIPTVIVGVLFVLVARWAFAPRG